MRKLALPMLSGLLSLLVPQPAKALSKFAERLVYWETQSPTLFHPSAEPFDIEHFEIPFAALKSDIAHNTPDKIRDALIFDDGPEASHTTDPMVFKKDDGTNWVRWIINPNDTEFAPALEAWLKTNGLDATRHTYFKAYRTASRSMIIEDPETGAEFSAKVSTNNVNGVSQSKGEFIDDGEGARFINEHIRFINAKGHFDHFKVIPEPVFFGIAGLDQSMTVRSLANMERTKNYYMPGTAVLNDALGLEIAKLNGAEDATAFWKEHFMKAAGLAMGEMYARAGIFPQSNHSQNLLVELDEDFHPTGKIVIRDLTDMYLDEGFFKSLGKGPELDKWGQQYVIGRGGQVRLEQWLLWQNSISTWPSTPNLAEWSDAYFDAFEHAVSEVTGMNRDELKPTGSAMYGENGYRTYSLASKGWQEHFQRISQLVPSTKVREPHKILASHDSSGHDFSRHGLPNARIARNQKKVSFQQDAVSNGRVNSRPATPRYMMKGKK